MNTTDSSRLHVMLSALMVAGLLLLGGCATRAPTIAHTHIGHSMTGWHDTPNQAGLFVTAENAAQTALQAAERATRSDNDLSGIQADVARVVKATNPMDENPVDELEGAENATVQYGLKNALSGAMNHVTYAAESPDASANVKAAAGMLTPHAAAVLDRCDLVTALGNDVLRSTSRDEAVVLTHELLKLTRANLLGEEANGDGVVGSVPAEYGLKQLRAELQAMIDRESPPYTTVDTWYLFNLVRLPTGEWLFRQLSPGSGSYRGY